jgi:hypothetical protein
MNSPSFSLTATLTDCTLMNQETNSNAGLLNAEPVMGFRLVSADMFRPISEIRGCI